MERRVVPRDVAVDQKFEPLEVGRECRRLRNRWYEVSAPRDRAQLEPIPPAVHHDGGGDGRPVAHRQAAVDADPELSAVSAESDRDRFDAVAVGERDRSTGRTLDESIECARIDPLCNPTHLERLQHGFEDARKPLYQCQPPATAGA